MFFQYLRSPFILLKNIFFEFAKLTFVSIGDLTPLKYISFMQSSIKPPFPVNCGGCESVTLPLNIVPAGIIVPSFAVNPFKQLKETILPLGVQSVICFVETSFIHWNIYIVVNKFSNNNRFCRIKGFVDDFKSEF